MNDKRERIQSVVGTLLGLWWISWFGIIGGFLLVGVEEIRRELSYGEAALPFSLAVLVVVFFSWVVFYVAASKFDEQWSVVWRLFMTMGTILAAFTLLEIYFFAYVAPLVVGDRFVR